jgi:hypothetical protein
VLGGITFYITIPTIIVEALKHSTTRITTTRNKIFTFKKSLQSMPSCLLFSYHSLGCQHEIRELQRQHAQASSAPVTWLFKQCTLFCNMGIQIHWRSKAVYMHGCPHASNRNKQYHNAQQEVYTNKSCTTWFYLSYGHYTHSSFNNLIFQIFITQSWYW